MFHICFAANENYIKYTAVLITSIIKSTDTSKKFKDFFETNTHAQNAGGGGASLAAYKKRTYNVLHNDEKREGYVFHLLIDKISDISHLKLNNFINKELNKIYPCEIRIHICENLPHYANLPTFFRLFYSQFMPLNVRLCLYLDSDMLVRQDLRTLFALDLDNKIAGVVKDNVFVIKKAHKKTRLFKDFYFNAGFLLLNVDEWRKQNTLDKCLKMLTCYKEKVIFADQDALNFAISKDKALVLPCGYNLFAGIYGRAVCNDEGRKFAFDYTRAEMNLALTNPDIWHFVGVDKPWNNPYTFVDSKGKALGLFWWDIALQTPYFSDDDFTAMQKATLPEFAFSNAVVSLMLQHSKSFFGYLTMPFFVYKAFKDKEQGNFKTENHHTAFTPNEQNLVCMLFGAASRAYKRRRKGRLLDLPHRVWRLKKHFERFGSAKIISSAKNLGFI